MQLQRRGLERWQVEQATINRRVWLLSDELERKRLHRPEDVYRMLDDFVEYDKPAWANVLRDSDAIQQQAYRDARYLLKQLGTRSFPRDPAQMQGLLDERGYLRVG
jgi:hypothetical protein